ncbi:hypothetical protein CVV26_02025 [Candidatus Kuenenbacteria bacterium HGW-Kuenenbacteria-1]|uniref:Uncharacterized protein n=1 Tax=Candidatus Kuenenbacteria bacterium HGW-Kuenenbacteria-1 TaxID=2013812 RepID=A0A2N1UNH7_9BACT|nr:MAG: hypothetical protein CVV26_02025 [Candidatus Kuenenbacteria bacterium HGW-Kuenenbacteria-1]
MNQLKFEKTISEFQKIEDARDQLWDRAKVLIEKGFEIEAYILILATWNFARFRYFMKNFDLREFDEVIKRVNPIFKKIENTQFENTDLTNNIVATDIKYIYDQLKKIAEQTGASKIMALKNSKLFVMWDTEIRKIYKIDNKGDADDYIQFLIKMQEYFKDIRWVGKTPPLAKAIDEYNYVIADRNRGVRKIKSRQRLSARQ